MLYLPYLPYQPYLAAPRPWRAYLTVGRPLNLGVLLRTDTESGPSGLPTSNLQLIIPLAPPAIYLLLLSSSLLHLDVIPLYPSPFFFYRFLVGKRCCVSILSFPLPIFSLLLTFPQPEPTLLNPLGTTNWLGC